MADFCSEHLKLCENISNLASEVAVQNEHSRGTDKLIEKLEEYMKEMTVSMKGIATELANQKVSIGKIIGYIVGTAAVTGGGTAAIIKLFFQ